MQQRIKTFLILACLVLGGMACSPQSTAVETIASATATPVTVSAEPTATPSPTPIAPPQVVVKTQAPPATLTPAPTAILPTPTRVDDATLPPPPPTAIPTEGPTETAEVVEEQTESVEVENGCRPLTELADVRPSYRLAATEWVRPAPNPNELHIGFGGDPPLIHLGFDVEGTTEHLGALLDVLDARGVKTTMFVMGSWAEAQPQWIEEMAARGHEFANHTFSHGNMKQMSYEVVQDEIERTEAVIQRLTGQSTKPYIRPPFGSRTEESVRAAYDIGYTTVIWSGSTEDWRPDASEALMCRTLLLGAQPGAIMYSHSWHPEVPAAVDRFIGEMQSRGYTFVPLTVMMSGQAANYLVAE